MSRWQDSQLAVVEFNEGANRLCLDRIPEDDENYTPEFPYRLVWRGDTAGVNKLVRCPAYFSMGLLGELIRQALQNGQLPYEDFEPFFRALFTARR